MSDKVLDDLNSSSKKEGFVLFRKSKHSQGIYEIAEILKANSIQYKIIDDSISQEMNFADTLHNEVELKLKPFDFDRANKLIKENIQISLDEFDKDYYLFQFSNEELYEILLKPDEWGDVDYKLSQQILQKRGIEVNEVLISTLRTQRIKELKKPESASSAMIVMGFIFAVLGGLLGILIGWYILTAKKTLPDGQRIYTFNKKDRLSGKIILIIGLIIFPFALYLKLVRAAA